MATIRASRSTRVELGREGASTDGSAVSLFMFRSSIVRRGGSPAFQFAAAVGDAARVRSSYDAFREVAGHLPRNSSLGYTRFASARAHVARLHSARYTLLSLAPVV